MTEIPERPDPLARESVQAFVVAAHGDLDAVRELLTGEPRLVNAAWDWGGGDWETGLGGAAHMGRRDIALHLLARGARLDVFAVAMLGDVDVIRALLQAFPTLPEVRGPHGISLIDHARAGGGDALEVVRLLEGHPVAGPR